MSAAFKLIILAILLSVGFLNALMNAEINTESEIFRNPIRIHSHFQQFDSDFSQRDISTIKECVTIVLFYLQQLLSINSINRSLLLRRSACARSWVDGPNKGKCAFNRRDYSGEYCKGGFKIPDEHLEGFVVWQYNASEPQTFFRTGGGVRNADYILYVQAITTSECVMTNYKTNRKSLIAYAAECKQGRYGLQVDRNGRPLAGYINFCPSALKEAGINTHKLILTIIHEVLHGLGFSKHYFSNFKDCSGVTSDSVCPSQRFPLYRKIGNYTRILTKNVVRQMQNHFLCYESDFGGPLEVKRHKYIKDSHYIQSHWDGKQMYGSVMSPSMGPPELTFVDPISLALLEDSGWYKVNYSMVEYYPWGKGKGCNFGNTLNEFNDATCKFNGVKVHSGCNVFHTHKMVCTERNVLENEVTADHICGVAEYLRNDESAEIDLLVTRCLLSNMSKSSDGNYNLKGQCFKIQCLDSNEIKVIVNKSVSVLCPVGQIIDLSTLSSDLLGIIVCPKEVDLICFRKKEPLYLQMFSGKTTAMITTKNVTLPKFYDILEMVTESSNQNLTSNGNCATVYEKLITKMLYTSIFCLIVLHVKIIDRLTFCMF